MKPLLIFATLNEAKETLRQSLSKGVSSSLWSHSQFDTLICGVGAFDAISRLQQCLEKQVYSHLINLGCAGSLQASELGTIYCITQCKKLLEQPTPIEHSKHFFEKTFPPIEASTIGHFKTARLGSVDCPLHQKKVSAKFSLDADLVDMEGYALAWIAKRHQYKLSLLKCVSDFGNENGPESIKKEMERVSQKLWYAVQETLKLSL